MLLPRRLAAPNWLVTAVPMAPGEVSCPRAWMKPEVSVLLEGSEEAIQITSPVPAMSIEPLMEVVGWPFAPRPETS